MVYQFRLRTDYDWRMRTVKAADPATEAWKAVLDLIGAEKPPRFPRIAAEFDLSPMQLNLLRTLGPDVELPMGALAGVLFCDPSNVTGIVDRMEARGLIERRPDPADRRVKRIAITPQGVALREDALGRLFEPPASMAQLTRAEQRQLRDLLRKLLDS